MSECPVPCFLPSFLDWDIPDDVHICRFLNTVDATALRATCSEVEDIIARYHWCDIKIIVWCDSEPQWRACFPRAQGYLSSEVVTRVIYKGHEEGRDWFKRRCLVRAVCVMKPLSLPILIN